MRLSQGAALGSPALCRQPRTAGEAQVGRKRTGDFRACSAGCHLGHGHSDHGRFPLLGVLTCTVYQGPPPRSTGYLHNPGPGKAWAMLIDWRGAKGKTEARRGHRGPVRVAGTRGLAGSALHERGRQARVGLSPTARRGLPGDSHLHPLPRQPRARPQPAALSPGSWTARPADAWRHLRAAHRRAPNVPGCEVQRRHLLAVRGHCARSTGRTGRGEGREP